MQAIDLSKLIYVIFLRSKVTSAGTINLDFFFECLQYFSNSYFLKGYLGLLSYSSWICFGFIAFGGFFDLLRIAIYCLIADFMFISALFFIAFKRV